MNAPRKGMPATIVSILPILGVVLASAIPSVAQTTPQTTLTTTLVFLKHVAGHTTDRVTVKASISNSGTTAISTDRIHADLHLSHDEIRDADDDMIAQKPLAAQVIEDAEQRGQDGTIIEPGGFVVIHWGINGTNTAADVFTFPTIPIPMNIPNGECALYTPFPFLEENFADNALMIDDVQWGEAGHFREPVAAGANM